MKHLTTCGVLALALLAAGCGGRGTAPGADAFGPGYSGGAAGLDGGIGAGAGAGAGMIGEGTLPGSSITDRVFFAVDQSTLSPQAMATLDAQIGWLRQNGQAPILVEGHADERGTREYNLALGARRASAVRNYMVAQGIPDGRISTTSYGRERPAATCAAENCWASNRRAVTVVTGAPGV